MTRYTDEDPRVQAVQEEIRRAVEAGEAVTVRSTGGHEHTARRVEQGTPYGLCAVWKYDEPGIVVDGTPGHWFVSTLLEGAQPARLSIDAGQGWAIDEEGTAAIYRLARGERDPRAQWLLADDALREVIEGETGDRMRQAVIDRLDGLREAIEAGEGDRYVDEVTDHESGGLFPYTFDMAQAWAESIHHVTFDPDASGYGYMVGRQLGDEPAAFDLVVRQVQAIVRGALLVVAREIPDPE